MIQITPSQLETWRLFLDEDWMTEPVLIERLTGTGETTRDMEIGNIIHEFIAGEDTEWLSPQAKKRLREEVGFNGLYEVEGEWHTDDIVVEGRVDRLEGNEIHEFKTTNKPINLQRYMASYQWRLYLLMFPEFKKLRYFIIHWQEMHGNNEDQLLVDEIVNFTVYPYYGMDRDVKLLAEGLVGFMKDRGIK